MATSTEAGSTSQSVHDSESASSVALSQRSESSDNEEENQGNKLTPKWLLNFFTKDWKHYYRTFELNECLYLHFKGFQELKCMELFPELKTLYFEGNGLGTLHGLESNPQLRCLYVHENAIMKMEGLQNCTLLCNLNLSDNLLSTIEGLGTLEKLDCLYLARNRVGRNGLDDLRGVLECPSITTLDLQNNKIDDPACLEEIFMNMPNLKVLYLQGNEVTSKIKNYRKTMIAKLPSLKYLDDRPVFVDDRRNAEAYARGGMDEERAERARIAEEKRQKDEANRVAFKDMIKKARAEKRIADEKKEAERSASPAIADGSASNEEEEKEEPKTFEVTTMIDTSSKGDDIEEDAPPELEQVDAEQLREEQEKMDNSQKQQQQMYKELSKSTKGADAEDEAEDDSCTVEEVKEEEPTKEEVAEPEEPKEERVSMADMVSDIDIGSEFVSTLEELD